jgi:hypothetical protein
MRHSKPAGRMRFNAHGTHARHAKRTHLGTQETTTRMQHGIFGTVFFGIFYLGYVGLVFGFMRIIMFNLASLFMSVNNKYKNLKKKKKKKNGN